MNGEVVQVVKSLLGQNEDLRICKNTKFHSVHSALGRSEPEGYLQLISESSQKIRHASVGDPISKNKVESD